MTITKAVKQNWMRYATSTCVTFLAGFLLAIYPELGNLTLDSFATGGYVGLLFAGVRAGTKLVIESFLAWYQNDPK